MRNRYNSKSKGVLQQIAVILLSIIVSFSTGYILGVFRNESQNEVDPIIKKDSYLNDIQETNSLHRNFLINEISVENIEKHLK